MKKIYFFNAANFPYAEIDLSKKNIFFVGDNGSGKTTAIRAIHFFYNSDVKALGIDANKESFKNFYFKYDNSFIVYEFEEYFVLMYKKRGEIKRIFSKKKFNVKEVDTNDFESMINYAKSAELKYSPPTNEEYKKIIYGLDRKHLDFKLTTIRNYNTFINLYNKIFNVNKAVFDANSIKEVIFTTLDRVEAGEIDYENFLDEISIFRKYFVFYNRFKNQFSNIEKLYDLKNTLLNLDEEVKTLLAKIAYRKEIEEKEVDELIKKIAEIERKINKKRKQYGLFEKKIRALEENIKNEIFDLKKIIEEIKSLKEKFSIEKLQNARSEVAKKEELEKRLIALRTSLNELIKGIKSQIDEIDEEIERNKREKRILKERLKEEEIVLKRNLEEIYEEKIEKIKEEFLNKENDYLTEIENIKKEIEKKLDEKEQLNDEIKKVNEKYHIEQEKIKNAFEDEKIKLINEKKSLRAKKDELMDEIYNLKRELKHIKRDYEEKEENILREFDEEIKKIEEKRIFYKNILKTIPNSFKEFLNQNVEGWEEDLYPLIDKKLLSMDIKDLKPKIINEPVCAIKVDTTKLETIPTMAKAEEELKRLNLLEESLKEEKDKKIEILKKELKSKEIEINSVIEVNEEKIKDFEKRFKEIDEEIKNLNEKLNIEFKKLEEIKNEEIKLIKLNIQKIDEMIKSLNNQINEIRIKIKRLKKEQKEKINELLKQKDAEFREKRNELVEKFKIKEKLIDEKINELNIKKNKISKDERINEIEKEIKDIEERLNKIKQSELFLEEFKKRKELIDSLKDKENELKKYEEYLNRIDEFSKKLFAKVDAKILAFEKEVKELNEKLDIIKDGISEVKKVPLSEEKIPTNEFLKNLINDYRVKKSLLSEKKIEFKEVASNIKTSLIAFSINGLDVNFILEKLADLLPEELEKVDELYLFKNKKFEVLKKAKMKELKNILDGLLSKKLEGFERSKEEFLNQVRRINQNLSKIDFGIIRNIKIEIEESKRNILKVFEDIRKIIEEFMIIENENEFFERSDSERKLKKVEELLGFIKKEVNKESFSLIDVIEISVKFIENEKENVLKIIKNESSTGGSILLKIAIAVSLLELFIKEKADLFLILDEVSVLSTKNQKLLKEFVNEKGLGVIYVTPDLPLVDVDDIDIYKFRNVKGEFEVVKLIADGGIKIN